MKINIANPSTGAQKVIEIEDEKKLRLFMEKRMATEVPADELGEQFKGYVFKITGGNDKQGFPMKQGVLTNTRVRLLLDKDTGCFLPHKKGERKKKSVRGCITGPDLAILSVIIVKKGPEEIPGLTDTYIPRRLGPKRANHIRKLFNLSREDDVRKYVVRREVVRKDGRKTSRAPKIQRLVTASTLQRRRREKALRKKRQENSKNQALEYIKMMKQRARAAREALSSKRQQRSSQRASAEAKAAKAAAPAPVKEEPKKKVPAKGGDKKAAAPAPAKGGAAKPVEKKGAKPAPAAKGGDKKAAAPAPAKGGDKKAAPAPAKGGDKKPAPAKGGPKKPAKK